jgi:flagellar hook-associated protein 2
MASVDGLISGLGTTDMINQLMKIEAYSQTALKNKVATANKVVSAYQSVNTRMSSVASAAKALGDPNTWGAMKATSSSDAAAVTASPGSPAGSLSFRVNELAATHTVTYRGSTVASPNDAILTENKFSITVPDTGTTPSTTKSVELTTNGTSLNDVVAAINGSAEAVYTAAAVRIGDGKYTLQLTAKESGQTAAGAMEGMTGPTGLSLTDRAVTVQGADAVLTVGSGDGAYEITSKTNTFADVLSGVTVTATRVQSASDAPVTIKLAADVDGLAAKVQALVDNANVALSEIASQSKAKNGEVAAGVLAGDSAMRKLTQDILSAVAAGVPGLGANDGTASLNDVGIGVDRSGKLTFEKQKFVDAYQADPVNTQKYFDDYTHKAGAADKFDPGFDTANGIARRLEALSLVASEGVVNPAEPSKAKQGTLQALIQRQNDTIRGLNDQVSAWDTRLELRRTTLERQFSSLEVALGKMQQQSSWLAGQLGSLPSYS